MGSAASSGCGHCGVLLFATAHNEDLVQLGASLAPRQSTSSSTRVSGSDLRWAAAPWCEGTPHWKEAFESSNGLTLEFAYLLTHGKRLQEVIGDHR